MNGAHDTFGAGDHVLIQRHFDGVTACTLKSAREFKRGALLGCHRAFENLGLRPELFRPSGRDALQGRGVLREPFDQAGIRPLPAPRRVGAAFGHHFGKKGFPAAGHPRQTFRDLVGQTVLAFAQAVEIVPGPAPGEASNHNQRRNKAKATAAFFNDRLGRCCAVATSCRYRRHKCLGAPAGCGLQARHSARRGAHRQLIEAIGVLRGLVAADGLQPVDHLPHMFEPLLRVGLQHVVKQCLERHRQAIEVRHTLPFLHRFDDAVAHRHGLAGQTGDHQETQRINVRWPFGLAPIGSELFGRDVFQLARELVADGHILDLGRPRDAKVDDHRLFDVIVGQHHVVGRQIAVDHADLVRTFQTVREPGEQRAHLFLAQRAVVLEFVAELVALDKAHDQRVQVQVCVRRHVGKVADDRVMVQLAQSSRFAAEHLGDADIFGHLGQDDLDRDAFAGADLDTAEHAAHAALIQPLFDPVHVVDHRAGFEIAQRLGCVGCVGPARGQLCRRKIIVIQIRRWGLRRRDGGRRHGGRSGGCRRINALCGISRVRLFDGGRGRDRRIIRERPIGGSTFIRRRRRRHRHVTDNCPVRVLGPSVPSRLRWCNDGPVGLVVGFRCRLAGIRHRRDQGAVALVILFGRGGVVGHRHWRDQRPIIVFVRDLGALGRLCVVGAAHK